MNTNFSPALPGIALALLMAALACGPAPAQSLTNNAGVTVLTFDPAAGDLAPVPDTYGDRVTSAIDAFGNRYGPGSGGTSNVTVEYGPAGSHVRKAQGPYGGLLNVACQEDGDFGALEIRLSADPGYQVALHRFDLAALVDDVLLPRVEVVGEHGTLLHAAEDLHVPGFRGGRTRLDFSAAPLVSGSVLIRLDLSSLPNTDSHLVGIDNIAFSQTAGAGCPRPPRLTITARAGGTVMLSWPGTGFRLESAPALRGGSGPVTWTTVSTNSPVTLTASGSAGFFRLTCP